jgi:hypothetical protein
VLFRRPMTNGASLRPTSPSSRSKRVGRRPPSPPPDVSHRRALPGSADGTIQTPTRSPRLHAGYGRPAGLTNSGRPSRPGQIARP